MSGWDDEEVSTTANTQPKSNEWGNEEKTDDFGGENRRGSGRGRGGRGRGRGNFSGNRDGGDNTEQGERSNRGGGNRGGFKGREGYNRDENNDGERPPRDFSDRPPRRNNNEGDEGAKDDGEEKPKRELYVPPEPSNDEAEIFSGAITAGINFSKFDKIEVSVTGNNAKNYVPIESFKDSGLREFLLENVKKSGYLTPTPIQKYAIPVISGKRDLMGCAQTGSGKTAAFILPILNTIMAANDTLQIGKPQSLIIAPTRELAIQIFSEARKFSMNTWVKVCLIYGGAATRYQSENVTQGCHILVATPGRLMDFVGKTMVTFEDLKFLVLDEADRMLDMGFRDTVDKICNHETIVKDNLTTLMFSATFPEAIQHMASQYLKDYIFLAVGVIGCASNDVEQEFLEVGKFQKRAKLVEILDQYCGNTEEDRILVFVETKRTADFLASLLSETTISSTSIHGDRLQREREEALRDFRTGKRKVLIATAVAARGLDIKGVTHVINYDIPKSIDEYVHRIGRTGRVGNSGKATSFFDPEADGEIRDELIRILKTAEQPIPAFLGDSAGGGTTTRDEDNAYGATDIRKPVAIGKPQGEDEDW